MPREKKVEQDASIKVAKVVNTTDPAATTEYVAWCDFTTFNGTESITIKKGDIVTAKDVPQTWIDQSVAQRWLILKADKEKLTKDEFIVRGYV